MIAGKTLYATGGDKLAKFTDNITPPHHQYIHSRDA